MNKPFQRLPGAKTRECFLSFQENYFAENRKMFSNPSLEMRFRLVKAEIHWAVKYRLSDGQNYPRGIIRWKNYILRIIWEGRGIIWKLRRIKLLAWALSPTCCSKTAAVALKRKCCRKIVLETVHWGLDERRRIWIFGFPFCRESFSSHPRRSVTLSSWCRSPDSVQIPITDSHAD